MADKDFQFNFEILKKNIYPKLKRKIITVNLQVEFDTLMNLLKDKKTLRTFLVREMHGICAFLGRTQKEYSLKRELFYIIPKKKDDILEINEFFQNNFRSNHIFVNNYVYKEKLIYNEEWEKYKKVIFRFIIQNKDKQVNNIIPNEKINENNLEELNFVDLICSFYIDINNSSTIVINEMYYNLAENEINRFCDVTNVFYEKAKNFISKNFNSYLCSESILINRSIMQIFNFIMSRKL
jgi:hypothetical protein